MSDLDVHYKKYLERADQLLGKIDVGGYGKHRGRLVKKLSPEEFADRWQHYQQLKQAYEQILDRGDTVNDAVVQLLNEHGAELLVELEY